MLLGFYLSLEKIWRCGGLNPGPFTCKANALPLSYIPLIPLLFLEPHKSEIEELLGKQVCETKAFNWTNQVMSN